MRKANIFIGSSSEAHDIAVKIKDAIIDRHNVQIWDEDIFQLGEDYLSSLLRAVQGFDFGLFVLTADDTTTSRGDSNVSPRDNVIFELGLFMGAIGRRRAFPVVINSPKKKRSRFLAWWNPSVTKQYRIKIPSDLLGQNMVSLSFDEIVNTEQFTKTMDALSEKITERFENEAEFELLPSTGSAVSYFYNFVLPVCEELCSLEEVEIANQRTPLPGTKFKFRILMPRKLRDANRHAAKARVDELKLSDVSIETENRQYPFYASAKLEKGNVVFWDYPTILKSSDEAVDHVTRGAFLGASPLKDIFDARELTNFEKSIRLLLDREDRAARFRDNLEIVSL